MYRKIIFLMLLSFSFVTLLYSQDTKYEPQDQQIPAPDAWEGGGTQSTRAVLKDWLADLTHWRFEQRIRIGYDGSRYDMPALKWTQSSFIQPQMMVHDRYFYNPETHKYTVDRYLDDLQKALRRYRRSSHLADLS